jgi:6-pyruvoyltetrahydropterin/6-carboxytetrahydropterin synthase
MKKTTIYRQFKFDSAHWLPYHEGRCHNLHGHSFKVGIALSGVPKKDEDGNSESGMVMDFGRLKEMVNKAIIDIVDHHCLNEVLPISNPTAESMSEHFFYKLQKILSFGEPDVQLEFVRIWETEDAYAEFSNS